jgi:transcription elongation factor GreA
MSAEYTYLTKEGLDNLKKELDHFKRVERPYISKQIAEARDKGDLSENAEYDAAKDAQGLLEAKISKLENMLASARLIDESRLDLSRVTLLSNVRVKNLKVNKEMVYTLVSEKEANLKENKISAKSAIGAGLLGKGVGDVVEINVPAGTVSFEILEISR